MRGKAIAKSIFKAIGLMALYEVVLVTIASIFTAIYTIRYYSLDEEVRFEFIFRFSYEIQLFATLVFFGLIVLIYRKKTLSATGLRPCRPLGAVAGGVMGFGAYFGVVVMLVFLSLIPSFAESMEQYQGSMEEISAANPAIWAQIVLICLIGPLAEEILCRGLIQNTLLKTVKPAVAISISALMFAILHGNLYQGCYTFALGLLLGYLAYRFGSILPAVFLHATYNSASAVLSILSDHGVSDETMDLVYFALCGFCVICIPLGIALLRFALHDTPKPAPTRIEEMPTYQGDLMAAPEFLIVGLGNPDAKYALTRHNCGFLALDAIAEREGIAVNNLRFRSLTGEGMLNGKKVLLMKPQTYMNLSGEAVAAAARFYKLPPERILVLFDDVNFKPGTFRIRLSGSAGGHNGIKSIISCLGSDAFCRVKLGVGALPEGWDMMNWVLGKLPPEDLEHIRAAFPDVHATARFFVLGETEIAMQNFNGKEH